MKKEYIELISHVLEGLSEEDLNIALPSFVIKSYKADDVIFRSGDLSNDLFIVADGSIIVETSNNNRFKAFELTRVGKGDIVGEMAFLDHSPRVANARCLHKTIVIEVSIKRLQALGDVGEELVRKIENIVKIEVLNKLRVIDIRYAKAVQDNVESTRRHMMFGDLVVNLIILLSISATFNKIVVENFRQIDVRSELYSWGYLIALVSETLLFLRYKKYSLASLGVFFKANKKSALQALIYIIPGYILIFLVSYSTEQSFVREFSFTTLLLMILYFFSVSLQEFMGRGLLQNSLSNFYGNKNKWTTIIISSLCFALFHAHLGSIAMIMTYISGIYFGMVYIKNRNLFCVILVHFAFGVYGYMLGWI